MTQEAWKHVGEKWQLIRVVHSICAFCGCIKDMIYHTLIRLKKMRIATSILLIYLDG